MPRRALAFVTVVASGLLLGGCGSGLPSSSRVNLMIMPAQASVSAGGTVALTGNATGFTQTPIVQWWIQEAQATGGDNCGYLQPPAASPCEFGYVMFGSVSQFPSSATYYAPSTAGTYHVVFEASQFSEFDHLTKTATATITVTR